MTDPDDSRSLAQLDARIAAAKAAQAPKPRADADYSMADVAWRMVLELVAGLVIGLGIGYGLDRLFGTIPIFLVLFVLLGFAAGVKTMLRSARELQARGMARDDETGPKDDKRG